MICAGVCKSLTNAYKTFAETNAIPQITLVIRMGFASKVRNQCWIQSDPTLPRYGTDCVQVRALLR